MKLASLYSGGKDSNYALFLASKEHEIKCLISMKTNSNESYMFQNEGNDFVKFQAEAMKIPLVQIVTKGEKEDELKDLKKAILKAKQEYKIEGIITGAIKSVYQASRVQKICDELGLHCFNPLWQIDEEEFLRNLIRDKFEVKIIGVAAYPLNKKYLGKTINSSLIENLLELAKIYKISPIFEGGEAESFVFDSPMFNKKLNVKDFEIIEESENCSQLEIKEVEFK